VSWGTYSNPPPGYSTVNFRKSTFRRAEVSRRDPYFRRSWRIFQGGRLKMPSVSEIEELRNEISRLKLAVRKRYRDAVLSFQAGLEAVQKTIDDAIVEAKNGSEAEIASLNRILQALNEVEQSNSVTVEKSGTAAFRPPTWKVAVLLALHRGSADGMSVSEILEAVQEMGVRTTGATTSRSPNLLVSDALRRLGTKARRINRGVWALNNSDGSPETVEHDGGL
jgi:hypothetical protein